MQNSASTRRLADALAAIARGETAPARDTLHASAAEGALLAQALLDGLDEDAARAVYDKPAAFEAFIRGGDNVPLYQATRATTCPCTKPPARRWRACTTRCR